MDLELLAPAGNFSKLKTAFYFGADVSLILVKVLVSSLKPCGASLNGVQPIKNIDNIATDKITIASLRYQFIGKSNKGC